MKQGRFYIPQSEATLFDEFLQTLKREGKSLSEWIRENAYRYAEQHKEGNPQLRIDKFSAITNHKRSPKDCKFWRTRKNPTPPYEAFCSKRRMMVLAASCCNQWKT